MVQAELGRPTIRFLSPDRPIPTNQPLNPALTAEAKAFSQELEAATASIEPINYHDKDRIIVGRLAARYERLLPFVDPSYPETTPGNITTLRDGLLRRIRSVGAMLLIREILEEERPIQLSAIRHTPVVVNTSLAGLRPTLESSLLSRQSQIDKTGKALRFVMLALSGELEIPIEGVKLLDIEGINASRENPQTLASHFRLLVKTALIENGKASVDEDVEAMSPDQIMQRFPLVLTHQATMAAWKVNALMELDPETVISFLKTNVADKEKACIKRALPLMKTMQALRARLRNALFDPNSADFSTIRAAVEEYFTLGSNEARVALAITTGLSRDEQLISAYRKAQRFVNEGVHATFFVKVLQTIIYAVEDKQFVSTIIKGVDDLPAIPANFAPSEIPARELIHLVSRLRNAGIKEFTLTPDQLSQPFPFETIQIALDVQNPHQFCIQLAFVDQQRRERKLIVAFDSQTGEVDWSVLEELASYPNWQSFLTKTAADALTAKWLVEQRKRASQSLPQTAIRQPAGLPGYLKRAKPLEDGNEPYQRPSRNGRPRLRTASTEILSPAFRVVFPTGKGLRKLTKGLTPDELQLIRSALISGDGLSPIPLQRDDRRIGATDLLRLLGFRLFLRRTNPSGKPSFTVVRIDRGN